MALGRSTGVLSSFTKSMIHARQLAPSNGPSPSIGAVAPPSTGDVNGVASPSPGSSATSRLLSAVSNANKTDVNGQNTGHNTGQSDGQNNPVKIARFDESSARKQAWLSAGLDEVGGVCVCMYECMCVCMYVVVCESG